MFWLILIIPLVLILASRVIFQTKITWIETAAQVAMILVVGGAIWEGGKYAQLSSTDDDNKDKEFFEVEYGLRIGS